MVAFSRNAPHELSVDQGNFRLAVLAQAAAEASGKFQAASPATCDNNSMRHIRKTNKKPEP